MKALREVNYGQLNYLIHIKLPDSLNFKWY